MTDKEERILEIIQERFLDVGIPLEGKLEKALVFALEDALEGYIILGKPKDIKNFKKGLPRFASHHNVTIVEK